MKTDAPYPGPGIVHLDADGNEDLRLPLPAEVTSPHGLAFDGTSLWMSDLGEDGGTIWEIDPVDGTPRTKLEGWFTEGIALDGEGFWVDHGSELAWIDRTGTIGDTRRSHTMVQDLAFDGTDVLVLSNASPDQVTRVDPNGVSTRLPEAVTMDNTGYAMTWDDGDLLVGDYFVVENAPTGAPLLRHIDPNTGAIVGTSFVGVEGWITAIAAPPR